MFEPNRVALSLKVSEDDRFSPFTPLGLATPKGFIDSSGDALFGVRTQPRVQLFVR